MIPADCSNSPVILIGTHRSGTTMLCKVLEQFGIFMGLKKDDNNESLFFQKLNRWMFNSIHAHWDFPQPFLDLLSDSELREMYVQYLRIMMQSPRVTSYMGFRNYIRYGHPKSLEFPWGWKDPRNTFTLPVWIEVFGGARVIHVRRHGVDVARSLFARNEYSRKSGSNQFARWRKFPAVYQLRPKKGGFTQSVRCNSLEDAFGIWQEYMQQAETVLQNLDVPYLDLWYEQILQQPEIELEKVLLFCGREHLKDRIPDISDAFDPKRAFAYRRKSEMRQFAVDHTDSLARFGYSQDF